MISDIQTSVNFYRVLASMRLRQKNAKGAFEEQELTLLLFSLARDQIAVKFFLFLSNPFK
jgi:hypothetical protein